MEIKRNYKLEISKLKSSMMMEIGALLPKDCVLNSPMMVIYHPALKLYRDGNGIPTIQNKMSGHRSLASVGTDLIADILTHLRSKSHNGDTLKSWLNVASSMVNDDDRRGTADHIATDCIDPEKVIIIGPNMNREIW